jgi:ABC-type Mn2+/Zn2+ transport system permease subunit
MIDFLTVDFMRYPFLAAVVMSAALVPLGVYVNLRRIIFVGIAAPQMAAFGAVVGAALGWPTFWPALAFAWVSIMLLGPLSRARQVSRGAVMALFYIFATVAYLLLLATNPSAETEVANVFFGNVLAVGLKDVFLAAAVAIPVVLVLYLIRRRINISLFDRDAAAVTGARPAASEFAFYALLGLSVATAMKFMGVLLTFTLLALPATVGLLWAKRMWQAVVASSVFATVGLYVGFGLSYELDWPTGPAAAAPLAVIALGAVVIKAVRRG